MPSAGSTVAGVSGAVDGGDEGEQQREHHLQCTSKWQSGAAHPETGCPTARADGDVGCSATGDGLLNLACSVHRIQNLYL